MARTGYIIHDQQGIYYMTFTVVGWIDVFSRQCYRDIVIESFKYCQKAKGLHLHAYVIMTNHIHLVVSVDEGHSISDFVRDCKKFTAKQYWMTFKIIKLKADAIGCYTNLSTMLRVIAVMKHSNYGSTKIILFNYSRPILRSKK